MTKGSYTALFETAPTVGVAIVESEPKASKSLQHLLRITHFQSEAFF